jgi:hypothetical protein
MTTRKLRRRADRKILRSLRDHGGTLCVKHLHEATRLSMRQFGPAIVRLVESGEVEVLTVYTGENVVVDHIFRLAEYLE